MERDSADSDSTLMQPINPYRLGLRCQREERWMTTTQALITISLYVIITVNTG